jgi:NAD-dependent dihydropyrimidine dehydrogenase PreA subunit
MADAEGIKVLNSRAIKSVLNDGVKATGIEYVAISSFGFDERGCMSIECTGDEAETMTADTVISAIGVLPDLDFLESDRQFTLSNRGTVEVDRKTFFTSVSKVFAVGDAVSGPSTVAAAVGSGRRAAVAVDRYLTGQDMGVATRLTIGETGEVISESCPEQEPPHVVTFEEILNVDFHEKRASQKAGPPRPEPANPAMQEIEGGLVYGAARLEGSRCFHCGHCTSCGNCVTDCPLYVLAMTDQGPQVAHFDECWHCGCCRIACPSSAVLYEFPLNMLV